MKKTVELFVGIDVSKAWLDVALHEQKETFRVGNDEIGIGGLVKKLKKLKPRLIVLEPTGGFEMLVIAELSQVGLPVAVVNGKRVRDFAKATGQIAKTDKLDARVLAHFAAAIRPEVRSLRSAEEEYLTALLTRRRQVLDMLTVEKNRLVTVRAKMRPALEVHILSDPLCGERRIPVNWSHSALVHRRPFVTLRVTCQRVCSNLGTPLVP